MIENQNGKVVKSYEIKEGIGQGGFGAVYRAIQPSIGREVAIKIILPEYASQADFIQRFEAEAQLVARLEHPHITPLYDYWRDPSGAYLVMRYLRGGSLRLTLQQTGAWDMQKTSQMLRQISSALAFAHINGVIHGDIKTDNILMDELGNAYLSDFGIAKSLGEPEQGNSVQGTLISISPEQIRGNRATVQSDVYTLGILVFETLTGHKPFFDDSTSAVLYKQLNEPLPPLSQFRPELAEEINLILQRATSKDPSLRYDNVLAFSHAFSRLTHETDDSAIKIQSPSQEVEALSQAKNPYKGLRAFQVADAEDFYGREALVENFLNRLSSSGQNQNFLAVIGASGSGKSSLVKAGMLPRIREGVLDKETNWYIAEMIPGSHPLEDLEAALLGIAMSPMPDLLDELRKDERGLVRVMKRLVPDGSKLLLLIDQFEEVFTLIADEDERIHFLNSILNAAEDERSRIKIIITLRADFYDRPLLYSEFGELVRRHSELVLRLNEKELEQAIVKPVERIGLTVEPSLLAAMINDVYRQPGALPLMQFALTELFERREGKTLNLKSYEEIGGLTGALARRADELYQGFDAEEQESARQLFLRLVNLGEGTDDTRRRVYQADLLSIGNHAAMKTVIEQFGKYRLLTFDHDAQTRASTIELAHEALIRQWQRLREWLDKNRESLRLYRRFSASIEEWVQAGKETSFLAQGSRLQQFKSLQNEDLVLNQTESEFLTASLRAHEEQVQSEEKRKARESALEQQSAQRLRWLTAVMGIAAIISFVLVYFALQARSEAETQAQIAATEAALALENEARARALQQEAQSRLLASQLTGIHASDAALAYSLGLEMLTAMENPPIAVVYTVNDLFLTNFAIREFFGHREGVSDISFAPDGLSALSATQVGHIYLWDIESASIIAELEGHTAWVPSIQFSADGNHALSASQDGKVIIWDIESRTPIRIFEEHGNPVWVARYSPDGAKVLSADESGTLILWDAATGEILFRIQNHQAKIRDIAFSSDGLYAVSVSDDASAILWNIQNGEELRHMSYESLVTSVAFAPDSHDFVLAGLDRWMELWSVDAEEPVLTYQNLGANVWGLSISPDSEMLVTIMENGHLEVLELRTGVRRHTLQGHRGFGAGLAISADSQYILSVAEDQSMFLWDLGSITEHSHWLATNNSTASSGAVSSDYQKIIIGAWDGTASIWDIANEATLLTLDAQDARITSVAYAADQQTVLTANLNGLIKLWDAETGEALQEIQAHDTMISALAYLPNAFEVLSVAADGTMRRWNLETGEMLQEYAKQETSMNALALLPDGTRAITALSDGRLLLWDLANPEPVRPFEGHRRSVRSVAISPDGTTAVSGSEDSRLILWDIETGLVIREFLGHQGSVEVVGFSPDGLQLVSGTNGGAIRVWDSTTGEFLRRFDARNWVVYLSYLPENNEFISVAGNGSVEVWQASLPLDELVNWVSENRYLIPLTCEERLRYYLSNECAD